MRMLKLSEVRISWYRRTIVAAPAWAFDDYGRPIHEAFADVMAEIVRQNDDDAARGSRIRRWPCMTHMGHARPRRCRACGVAFMAAGRVDACTDRCAKTRRDATRTRPEPNRIERAPRECGYCGERFHPARANARFCSGRCRVAHHRATSWKRDEADG